MAQSLHPAAPHDLPAFITAPGDVAFGLLFLRLHTLPERMAHKSHKIQFEIVAVLGLIALFTHMHIFWIAGLLLALIDLPDFGSSLGRIAKSTEKIAGIKPGDGGAALGSDATSPPRENHVVLTKPAVPSARRKEPSHA